MSQNVAEEIESKASTLFEKLASNVDLSNVIMGFLGRVIIICKEKGKPIQGVSTTEVTESNDEFRFGLSFNTLVITPMAIWQAQHDLVHYIQSRSSSLAQVLQRNQKLVGTFNDLVSVIDKYCQRKGMKFRDFKVKKAFIHPKTNTCVIRAGIPDFKDRFK